MLISDRLTVLSPSPDQECSSFIVREMMGGSYTLPAAVVAFGNQHKAFSDPYSVLPWFLSCVKMIPMVCFRCFLTVP